MVGLSRFEKLAGDVKGKVMPRVGGGFGEGWGGVQDGTESRESETLEKADPWYDSSGGVSPGYCQKLQRKVTGTSSEKKKTDDITRLKKDGGKSG